LPKRGYFSLWKREVGRDFTKISLVFGSLVCLLYYGPINNFKIILKIEDYGLKTSIKKISKKAEPFLILLSVLANSLGNSFHQLLK
jgi:hypothetical protein